MKTSLGPSYVKQVAANERNLRRAASVQTPDEYYAKRFSQADIDRAVKAERDRLENVLKDLASRVHTVLTFNN